MQSAVRNVVKLQDQMAYIWIMEAFVYGGSWLTVYLYILFNLFLLHGYVSDVFCQSTIIPLVKCKSEDLSYVNNYTVCGKKSIP